MRRNITRRQFVKVSAVGVAATGALVATGRMMFNPPDMGLENPYPILPNEKPLLTPLNPNAFFFDEHQYALVATLAALVIPTDEDPGATEANVVDYIDRLVAQSKEKQTEYAKGLNWIDTLSEKTYGKNFFGLKIQEQIDLLRSVDEAQAVRSRHSTNLLERVDHAIDRTWEDWFGLDDNSRFFSKLRADVFHGYYSNPISWKVVGYFGPPQPVGYLDYADPPSAINYTDTARPIDNETCQSCHFDQTQKSSHKERLNCTECHSSHFVTKGES